MRIAAPFHVTMLVALGASARAEILYTIDDVTDTLCTFDTSTHVITPIGALGAAFSFGDLAYDGSTGTMYMVDGWGGGVSVPSTLYRVDLTTGAATVVGSTNAGSIFGLVYDPTANKLYGTKSTIGTGFYEIDRNTGAATFIGDPGHGLDGVTYVGSTNAIVGIFAGPGSVHQIAPTTGASSLLSAGGGFVNNCGVAWVPSSNLMYSIDASGEVYAFDVSNSYARSYVVSGLGAFDGLAFIGPSCITPLAYCTGGTTTSACVASIASSGTPSLAASSGFTISVSNVEGQKSGIFFYSIGGMLTQPWATGSTSRLCIKIPTQRTTTENSGGSANQCDGSFALDWRAYMAANPGALGQPLVVGEVFDCQAWFQDPPAPKTSNLSNALRWVVCP